MILLWLHDSSKQTLPPEPDSLPKMETRLEDIRTAWRKRNVGRNASCCSVAGSLQGRHHDRLTYRVNELTVHGE